MKLLLAEDEMRMAEALKELLIMEGYDVDCVCDGEDALDAMRTGIYDVIILDVMMPKMNGFAAASRARKEGIRAPILMLTAKSGLDDKVTGFDSGADDYLTKPFMTRELLARLRALTRRNTGYQEEGLSYGDILLVPSSAELSCTATGQSVKLSEKEYRILEYMIANKGRILTREQLAVRIWGYDCEAEYNNVEVYMSFTRKKLSFVGAKTQIKAVRGIGYELRCRDVS
ncbi:MAG: response regulator transcription factor [Lachnospiraceae bacterium]|nr:response regulator transcription factor [Lachnospiraceae bacterium]